MKELKGIGASNGVSNAKTFILTNSTKEVEKKSITDVEQQDDILDEAVETATEQILKLKDNALKTLGEEKAAVFDAHIAIVSDPAMINQTKEMIATDKVNASYAFDVVSKQFIDMFETMEDEYMRERAADVKDVSKRVINIIEGTEQVDLTLIDSEVIIIAEDLTPSETSQLNPIFIKGFVTSTGGRTSHSAIMARSLEIPAIVGVGADVLLLENNKDIVINGSTGEIVYEPSKEVIDSFTKEAKEYEEYQKEASKYINKESITLDGHKVEVAANIGSPNDIQSVKNNGADGVGLFRSEFLYMDNSDWPTEEEQFNAYKEVVEKLSPQRVVIRTLDIGGDKKLSYYSFPEEMNPFLGFRAIRFELERKDIFKTQARALLRASAFGNLAINIPMIATINEFLEAKEFIKNTEKELRAEGVEIGDYQLGVMVETPATVALSDNFAKYADFFSVGSNDLIQYSFAADRMSEKVSYLYQPFNPSILRMLKLTIESSHLHGKWTAVCGELAGDPMMAPLLLGMGLDEFSMSASSVPFVRMMISKLNKSDAEKLVEEVINLDTEEQVIAKVKDFLANKNIKVM